MTSRISRIAAVLAALALCISIVSLVISLGGRAGSSAEGDIQYVLYLGTNDKDTNEPVFDPEEAKQVLKKMLISRMGGYTIQEANGGWIGDDGTEYQEYTLVIYLSDTSLKDVHSLCDELIVTFRQSSVLIQMNETTTEFYAG